MQTTKRLLQPSWWGSTAYQLRCLVRVYLFRHYCDLICNGDPKLLTSPMFYPLLFLIADTIKTLGISSFIISLSEPMNSFVCGVQGSNLWPLLCKSSALPAELTPHIHINLSLVASLALSVLSLLFCCRPRRIFILPIEDFFFAEVYRLIWLPEEGVEPTTLSVWRTCSNHLSYSGIYLSIFYTYILTKIPKNFK